MAYPLGTFQKIHCAEVQGAWGPHSSTPHDPEPPSSPPEANSPEAASQQRREDSAAGPARPRGQLASWRRLLITTVRGLCLQDRPPPESFRTLNRGHRLEGRAVGERAPRGSLAPNHWGPTPGVPRALAVPAPPLRDGKGRPLCSPCPAPVCCPRDPNLPRFPSPGCYLNVCFKQLHYHLQTPPGSAASQL